jgi:hypothetical protein
MNFLIIKSDNLKKQNKKLQKQFNIISKRPELLDSLDPTRITESFIILYPSLARFLIY